MIVTKLFYWWRFSSHLSSTTHEGIDVCLLSSALNKPKYKTVIDTYFNQIANKEENLFEYGFRQWRSLYQYPKVRSDKPIEIMYFSTGTEAALLVQT
jgi:Fe-S cluster assembly protein SufD